MHELKLPSGLAVTFRAPRNKDRRMVLEKLMGDRRSTGGGEDVEILSSLCLETIGGRPATEVDPDPRYRMDSWELKDCQFYQSVFLEMFFLDNNADMNGVRDAAKKLMSAGTATV